MIHPHRPVSRRAPTLGDLRAIGRDPFAIFRADEALAIDPGWLARVADGAPLAFWDDEGEDAPAGPERPPYDLQDGVAVYEVEGALSQRGYYCWQGYDSIARDVQVALDDARVRTLVLKINSPGGSAAGLFEAVRTMRAAVEASGKRCVAYADEMAYSAAYALACIADEIVLPEPGGVGSVGVIAGLQSYARAMAAAGVDVRVITSGAEKADGSPALPIDEAAVARMQARVDELAGIFARWVASRRGMTPEGVRKLEAGVRYGQAAVSARLADRIGGLDDLLRTERTNANPTKAPTMTDSKPAAEAAPTITPLAQAIEALTGKTDPAEQVGALAAVKARLDAGALAQARVAELEQALEARERESLIAQGEDDAKITTDEMRAWAAEQPLATLRSYLAAAPSQVPQGRVAPPPPPESAKGYDLAGKTWGDLTAAEKHRLHDANRGLYDRLKAAHDAAHPHD